MQGKFSQGRGSAAPTQTAVKRSVKKPLLIGLCSLAAAGAVGLGGFALLSGSSNAPDPVQEVTAPAETAPTEAAKAAPVVTADGKADSLSCQADYLTGANADAVVATVGDTSLTNRQLSLLYGMEIAAFRAQEQGEAPDFSQPLETQKCPLAEGLSWQHYFLRQALNRWGRQQAINMGSMEPQIITEELYQPNLERHEKYFGYDFPAKAVYYGDKDKFIPNALHQQYLDEIPESLSALAAERGFADAEAMAAAMAEGAGAQDLAALAEDLNRAYMYYTELSYSVEPDEAAIAEAASGERLVDMRHILLIPENAQIGSDMTVTASDEDWAKCQEQAEALLKAYQKDWRGTREGHNAVFAEKANQNSKDEASRIDGGRYVSLRRGQMIDELDSWLFDDARQSEDVEIIRTRLGVHIVFFMGSRTEGEADMRRMLTWQALADTVAALQEKYPMQVDYSVVSLTPGSADITAEDLMYPDVAHERYPSIPLYLQQDFPTAKFGKRNVAQGGCGITTLGMISTYMADTTLTPAYLADVYSRYSAKYGTDGQIFTNTPPDMGYFLQKQSWSWDDVDAALRNGQIVVTLQYAGYFTSLGHYMALDDITEDGMIVVRDSNIFNYGKLPDHKVDCFAPGLITAASQSYWIYEAKVTRLPACARCGDSAHENIPGQLLKSDYLCQKCEKALTRRDGYLALMAQ